MDADPKAELRTEAAELAEWLHGYSQRGQSPESQRKLQQAAELLRRVATRSEASVTYTVTSSRVAELRAEHDQVVREFREIIEEMRKLGRVE